MVEDSLVLGYDNASVGNQFAMFRRHFPSKCQEQTTQWCSIISWKNGVLELQCPRVWGRTHIYKSEASVTDQHSSTSVTDKFKFIH